MHQAERSLDLASRILIICAHSRLCITLPNLAATVHRFCPKPSRSGSTKSPDPTSDSTRSADSTPVRSPDAQTDGELEPLPEIVLPDGQNPPAVVPEENRDLAIRIVAASAAVVVRAHGCIHFDVQSSQTQARTDLHWPLSSVFIYTFFSLFSALVSLLTPGGRHTLGANRQTLSHPHGGTHAVGRLARHFCHLFGP